MANIHIRRNHHLGMDGARKVAWQWSEAVEEKFDMSCTIIEGETSDTVEFVRSGCKGRLIVAADHFADSSIGGKVCGCIGREVDQHVAVRARQRAARDQHRRLFGDGGFGRWIPIADNRSLRAQDIKLWLARCGQVGVDE